MRKLCLGFPLFLALLVPCAGLRAEAAEAGKYSTAVYTNALYYLAKAAPTPLLLWNLGLMRAFGDHNSLVLEGVYAAPSMSVDQDTVDATLLGGGLGWRFNKRRMAGWFIGPKANLYNLDVKVPTKPGITGKGQVLALGAEAGYQEIVWGGLLLECSLGIQWAKLSASASGTIGDSTETLNGEWSSPIPLAAVNIGWAF